MRIASWVILILNCQLVLVHLLVPMVIQTLIIKMNRLESVGNKMSSLPREKIKRILKMKECPILDSLIIMSLRLVTLRQGPAPISPMEGEHLYL